MKNRALLLATLMLAGSLAACGIKPKPAEVNPTDMPKGPGLLSGQSGNLLNAFKGTDKSDQTGGRIGVSIFLWRAALDSVDFMPLLTADSQGGVIITDWYTAPQTPNERAKINIVLTGKNIHADAVKVTLFKQRKEDGAWVDVPPSPATARTLEDAILTKARALRVKSLADK